MIQIAVKIREFLHMARDSVAKISQRVAMAFLSQWKLAFCGVVGALFVCAWRFYLHTHLWLLLSKQTDSSLATALYVVGVVFVLLGFVVNIIPPKTNYWKAAGVLAFLVVFYTGFVVTKEQATRMTLANQVAASASVRDEETKQNYDRDVTSLRSEMKGTQEAIESLARGSQNPKWTQLLAQVDTITKANAIKVSAKEPPRFALDSLSVTTSFPSLPSGATTSTALARFHVVATNVGESTAHGWKIQIQMMDQTGGRYVANSMKAEGGVADDTEPGRSQVFMNSPAVVIPFGCGPQIIRVWMKYGDLLNPTVDLPPQVFYRSWAGWNNPAGVTEVRAEDVKPIEAMFAREFPMPQ